MNDNRVNSYSGVPSARLLVSILCILVVSILTACGFELRDVKDKSANNVNTSIETVTLQPTFTPPASAVRTEDSAATAPSPTHTAVPSPTVTAVPPTATPVVYTVQSGDTLGAIADQFGVTVDEIIAANSIPNPDSLSIGTSLVIPVASQGEQVVAQASEATDSDGDGSATGGSETNTGSGSAAKDTPIVIEIPDVGDSADVHYVAEGETLSGIAEQYGITLEALLMANGLANDAQLMAGEPLVIPKGTPTPAPTRTPTPGGITPTPTATPVSIIALSQQVTSTSVASPTPTDTPVPPTPTPVVYTVQRGDTPGRIARQFGVTTDELFAANPDLNAFRMQVGDRVVIPTDAEVLPTATPTSTPTPVNMVYATHVVEEGETVDNIAAAYDLSPEELRAANETLRDATPAAGDTVRIPVGTATPTTTPTPIATRTPTPGPKYVAPFPLSPKGERMVSLARPVLSWASTGILAEDEFYAIRVRFVVDGTVISTESFRTKRTSLRLPAELTLPTGRLILVRWDVLVMQQTDETDADPGEAMSALSTTAEFYWRRPR